MRAAVDALAIADQLAREGDRRVSLPHSGRTVEEVRVRGALGERCAEQPLRLGLLRNAVEARQ